MIFSLMVEPGDIYGFINGAGKHPLLDDPWGFMILVGGDYIWALYQELCKKKR